MHHVHFPSRRTLLRIASLGAVATLLPGLAGCFGKDKLEVHGTDVTGADFGKDFSLLGPDEKTYTLGDFRDKLVMIFFGFTQCPDVCPTALARASEIKHMLGKEGENFQVLFVTVDPERDTPEVLKAYTNAFDPSFLGLYGDRAQTDKTVKDFRIYAQKVKTGNSYTMDHTSLSYLYDKKGQLRVLLRHEQNAEECTQDIQQVLSKT